MGIDTENSDTPSLFDILYLLVHVVKNVIHHMGSQLPIIIFFQELQPAYISQVEVQKNRTLAT